MGPLERRRNRLFTLWLVAIGLLADLTPVRASAPRKPYPPRAERTASAPAWGRPARPYVGCAWDDVAFLREEGKKFCSARCEAAAEAAPSLAAYPGEQELVETDIIAPRFHILKPRRTNLDYYDRRESKRKSERLSARAFAKLMRTDAEKRFAPQKRVEWIGPNLAVLR